MSAQQPVGTVAPLGDCVRPLELLVFASDRLRLLFQVSDTIMESFLTETDLFVEDLLCFNREQLLTKATRLHLQKESFHRRLRGKNTAKTVKTFFIWRHESVPEKMEHRLKRFQLESWKNNVRTDRRCELWM